MDESVTNFMAITGCTNDDDARRFLLSYDNDMNRAVDRYFNQKNRNFVNRAPSSSSSSMERNGGVEVIEAMDTNDAANEPGPSRRRQPIRRAVAVRNNHPAPSAPEVILDDDEEDIRRPIAPISGQLVNESFQQTWRAGVSRPTNGIFQATTDFRALARQQEQRMYANRVNGGPPNGLDRKPKTLQTLFQPPAELLFIGPWEAARHQATFQSRWLLVNLQNNSEFSCACLNRDIWNKEMVQELIKKNFIFWQVADDSPDLMEFLERYPDFAAYDQSFAQNLIKPGPSVEDIVIEEAAINGTKKQGSKRKLVDDETPSSSKRSRISQSNSQPNSQASAVDVDMGEIDELCNNGTKLTTVDREEWKNFIGPEEVGYQKIQIVFRLPNNEREKIEIPDTTELRALFCFLDGRGLNSRDHVLVLTYPRREYFYNRHSSQSLRQLGFNRQELIHVDRK
uniref:UBX domain-containing protein n=1 Tax=Panagrolaimus superbus TaxID=310955 RepID=A0A914YWF9_9BILA